MNNVGSIWWDKHIIVPHKASNADGSKKTCIEIWSHPSVYKCILDILYLIDSYVILQSEKPKDISVQTSTHVLNVTFFLFGSKFSYVKWKNHK